MMRIKETARKWLTLATVCFALLMIVLDGNVVNLAMPQIMKNFGASLSQIEWVNNAYLLSFAVLLITLGRLGDELGRKKLFSLGLIFFTIGSILCGTASDVNWLIAYRIIQGIGGAAMMPATLSLIAANFEKKERGAAMGIWGAVAGLGIVLGPIVGGYLTDRGLGASLNSFLHITEFWRYVFYINLPVGLLALVAAFLVIPESTDRERSHRYDIMGILLSSLSVFLLTYGFIEGTKYGWWRVIEKYSLFGKEISFGGLSVIPMIFALALALGVVFVFYEKTQKKDPLVDLKLFRKRNFSVGVLVTGILSFGMMGSFFLLPLFLQVVMGYTPIKTGQVLMPFAITIMVMAPIAGRLADKIGGKYLIVVGLSIMALGSYLLAHFRVDTEIRDLILPFVVTGIGMGLSQAPLTNTTLLETPEEEVGGASGVSSTARQIGSVMGIAILGAFLQASLASTINKNIDQIADLPASAKSLIIDNVSSQSFNQDRSKLEEQLAMEMKKGVPAIEIPANLPAERRAALAQSQAQIAKEMALKFKQVGERIGEAVKKSFVQSINDTFKLASLIALFGAVVALLLRNKKAEQIKG